MDTNELRNLIKEYDVSLQNLNNIKDELRNKEYELKTLKLHLEYDNEYEEFRKGLKVKEIPNKINDFVQDDCIEIIELKRKKDNLICECEIMRLTIDFEMELLKHEKEVQKILESE